ncbi:MAG: uroporphyrinogen decarboxylase family protein [Lentisphaeria bacterium]
MGTMTRRERLLASIRGEPVDRPPVCFYELNGLDQDPTDPDPFNIYADPSWQPVLELTRERTDRIVMRHVPIRNAPPDPLADRRTVETWEDENGSRCCRTTLKAASRTLTSLTRRDRDTDTVWTIEHLLKDADDLAAWLDLPETPWGGEPDIAGVLATEQALGDSGIVMLDTSDALCRAAALFDLGTYTVLALTEPELFHRLMERCQRQVQPQVEAVARALPGRLWRIYGPEYAGEPYLPPHRFRELVVPYDRPLVDAIHRHGGYARIHAHGRLKKVLEAITETGCMGLDPVEPPPQGDVALAWVREHYGKQFTLFGNLEMSELATLPTDRFRARAAEAVKDGTSGTGRGFVLMPTACHCSRQVPDRVTANYQALVETVGA